MRQFAAVLSLLVCAALARGRAQCSTALDSLSADQKSDQAMAQVRAALQANPNDAKAIHCMGELYERQGKSGDAVDWYEKAIKLDDQNPLHHLSLAGALGTEAQRANKLRQPFLARRIKSELERAVELSPKLVEAHDGLVQYYLQAPGFLGGSVDHAKEQAEIIAGLDPLQGHLERAVIAQHDKDLATAEGELKAAVALAPDSLLIALRLGGLYENQKRWAEAANVYERFITLKPGEPLAHYLYGRVAALSGENLERGEREMRYWIANAPPAAPLVTRAGAHLRLGMILEREGKSDAARAEYETALSINAKDAEAKRRLDALK